MAGIEDPTHETTMEEREELLLSPLGGHSTLRTAHFLKPSSAETPPPYPLSSNPTISSKEAPLKIKLNGRRYRVERWASWVHQLLPKYYQIWKKAGIFEAILSSTYQITRTKNLLIPLAEKWNCETNTFVFPWGESTLTLEDMRVLGGYSVLGYPVLGYPVLSPEETREISKIEQGLCLAQREIRKGRHNQTWWMKYFMGSGHILEHEAFLLVWLARYVLPYGYEFDSTKIFPLAIHLSRGTPFALAPAVLASIYRDLSFLKKSIISSSAEIEHGKRHKITLWAPFQLVMMWVWERFPTSRPNPNLIQLGDHRSARWHGYKPFNLYNVRDVLDSAGECFQWRPYALVLNNWDFNKFYKESEEWVLVNPEIDGDLVSFVLCIRVGELVGLNCIEQYLPHRVAMQFGYDQNLPGDVPRFNKSFEAAWINYCRPIRDEKLYIPARLFESDVTAGYYSWRTSLVSEDVFKNGIRRKPRSKTTKRLPSASWGDNPQALIVPAGSPVDEEDGVSIAEFFRRKKTKRGEIGLTGDDSSSDFEMVPNKQMKVLIQKDPPQSISSELSILETVTGLNHPWAASNKDEEVISNSGKNLIQADPPQPVSEHLSTLEDDSSAATDIFRVMKKIRTGLEVRFTNLDEAIAELKQQIKAYNN